MWHAGSTKAWLRLDASASKLTALHSATLLGKRIQLGGSGLPSSLTHLRLEGIQAERPLPTVSAALHIEECLLVASMLGRWAGHPADGAGRAVRFVCACEGYLA